MRENIQRAEKLNVLSELSASVAHEIRNPMTTARGFMQLLKQQSGIDETKRTRYIEMVIDELDRAQLIITDFLSFAKPQAEKYDVYDLWPLLQQGIEIITPYATMRNVEIRCLTDNPQLSVRVNKDKLIQCFVNLLKNGVEAVNADVGVVQVGVFRSGEQAEIRFIDNGAGMTSEEVKRLGEPFYSTKEKGTGLGMMLCFRLIQSFQGKISIRSEKGAGTEIGVWLPVYGGDADKAD